MNIHHRKFALAPAALLAIALPALAGDGSAGAGIGDNYFRAGSTVELREPISGDAMLAGATVESNASVGGDATLAGGDVAVRATVGDDLYAAGGQVEVDALVNGSARIAGGRVRILPESRIDGGVSIAGGTVTAQGTFGRYLTVAGGDVTVGGVVDGDVRVYADSLTVLPGTRIGGRLTYRTSQNVTLPGDVEIGGGTASDDAGVSGGRMSGQDRGPGGMAGRVVWLWVAGLFAVGLLLAFGLARFSHETTRVLTGRPWLAIGLGFLVLVCVPAIVVALLVTLIGIPIALILLLVYVALLIVAYVVGALFLADRALARVRPGTQVTAGWRLLTLFAVLIGLAIVGGIPLLGSLAHYAVLLLGLGGIVLALWGGSRAPPAPA